VNTAGSDVEEAELMDSSLLPRLAVDKHSGLLDVQLDDLVGQQRQHSALLAKGVADGTVDGHERLELSQILPQVQRDTGPRSRMPR
jgi:hypothetical protein